MSRSRYRIYETHYPYFLTLTINNWTPLFTHPATTKIILDALQYRRENREFTLHAYVILENHIHLIAQSEQLDKEMASFKSWTARQIIDMLKTLNAKIQNREIMRQKIEYIHNNPVKRGYVDKQEHWRYSSARNYLGMEGLIDIDRNW